MIRTRSLAKDFGVAGKPKQRHGKVGKDKTVHAVRGITLQVEPGELVAVLGPNGAGKTTTMRMLTTLIAPTSGSAEVAGFDVVADPAKVRMRIGYVGQGNAAGHNQKARDELYSQGLMYGLSRIDADRRAGELLDALDLRELADRKVSALSGGQRRRLDVAMGLVHAPTLLFLDEPTTGLDPQNRANLWAHIDRMRVDHPLLSSRPRSAHPMTIVLTTHYLDEADSMAERVVIVDHGEVIADDSAEALKAKLAGDRITLTVVDPADAQRLAELAQRLPGARDVTVSAPASAGASPGQAAAASVRATVVSTMERSAVGSTVEARVDDGPRVLPELIVAAHESGIPIAGTQVFRPTLDDVFLNLTGRSLRESDETPKETA